MLKNRFSPEYAEVHITHFMRPLHYCMGPSGKLVPSASECALSSFFVYDAGSVSHLQHELHNIYSSRRAIVHRASLSSCENASQKKYFVCKYTVTNQFAGVLLLYYKTDLCQPGSYYPSRIINPSPPVTDSEFRPFMNDQPVIADKHARSVFYPHWITDDDPTNCLPCPENTYSEEYGQSGCLPCPFQHSIPTDPRSDIQPVVIQGMLGREAGNYVKQASVLKRVGIIFCILCLPGVIAVLLVFIAYVLIDVGSTLIQMANSLHPLQIQIAETSTANTRFDADQRKAAEEVYKRMKSD
ncbi:unnamed protein product [Trichobilharzia regenti]|nr:unnamed protein product [Trichobilharzia regenti]